MKHSNVFSRSIASDGDLDDRVRTSSAPADSMLQDDAGSPQLGISAEPGRIRLDGRRALTLDALDPARTPSPEPEQKPAVDWAAVAAAADLTRRERQVFMLLYRDQLPMSAIHHRIRTTSAVSEKLRRIIEAKLILSGQSIAPSVSYEPQPHSSRPAYRERLASGARPWALTAPDPAYAEIMNHEKYFSLLSQRHTSEFRKSADFCARVLGAKMPVNDLQTKLKTETAKLSRIAERLHAARLAAETAERELLDAEAAMQREAEDAVLEERPSDLAPLEKKIANLKTAQRSRQSELAAVQRAHAAQEVTVLNIEGEILARRYETFLAATLPGRTRIRQLIEDLALEMEDYESAAVENAQAMHYTYALFPFDRADPITGSSYRNAALSVAHAALQLRHHRWQKAGGSVMELSA